MSPNSETYEDDFQKYTCGQTMCMMNEFGLKSAEGKIIGNSMCEHSIPDAVVTNRHTSMLKKNKSVELVFDNRDTTESSGFDKFLDTLGRRSTKTNPDPLKSDSLSRNGRKDKLPRSSKPEQLKTPLWIENPTSSDDPLYVAEGKSSKLNHLTGSFV